MARFKYVPYERLQLLVMQEPRHLRHPQPLTCTYSPCLDFNLRLRREV